MRLVLSDQDGLNAISCDRLLARLMDERVARVAELTIDLRPAAFIDPYGAACLTQVAQFVVDRGQRLVCVMPSSERAQATAMQMGLVRMLRLLAEVRNILAASQPSGQAGTLPLSPIRSRSDVQQVLAYLVNLARTGLDYELGDVLDATKVVSELCYNVVDHSGAEGLAVAQIYHDRQGRRFAALAVVDAGIGIRSSLARRYPEAQAWRHGQAMERALGGLSSRPEGGGAGLRNIHAVVQRTQGRLAIRSGDERLHVAADRRPRTLSGASFPGTQVGISFSQR